MSRVRVLEKREGARTWFEVFLMLCALEGLRRALRRITAEEETVDDSK